MHNLLLRRETARRILLLRTALSALVSFTSEHIFTRHKDRILEVLIYFPSEFLFDSYTAPLLSQKKISLWLTIALLAREELINLAVNVHWIFGFMEEMYRNWYSRNNEKGCCPARVVSMITLKSSSIFFFMGRTESRNF